MASTKIINVFRTDKFEDILELVKNTEAKDVVLVLPKRGKAMIKDDHFATLAAVVQDLGKKISILSTNPETLDLAKKYDIHALSTASKAKGSKLKAKLAASQNDVDEGIDEDIEHEHLDPSDEDEIDLHHQSIDDLPEKKEEDEVDEEIGKPLSDIEEDEDEHHEHGGKVFKLDDDDRDLSKELSELEDISTNKPKDYFAVLASIKNRIVADIIPHPKPENSTNLKISKKSERPSQLEIKTDDESSGNIGETALNEIRKVWETKNSIWAEDARRSKKPARSRSKFPSFNFHLFSGKKSMFMWAVIAVVVIGAVLFATLGSAQITIKPKSQALSAQLKIVVSNKLSSIDANTNSLPGQLFNVSKNIGDTFPATGERDVVQKARGTITVYNNYGTSPQTLIANTRFESSAGLVFRTLKNIVVPGTTVKNGQITAGRITVEIIADKAGNGYNIGPGKFTIPAFKEKGDTDRYQKFYGQSTDATSGGMVGKAKTITEQDYNNAKNKIEDLAMKQANDEIKQQSSGLQIINLPDSKISKFSSTGNIDDTKDSFVASASAKVEAMGFNHKDLLDVINAYLLKTNNLTTLDGKVQIDYRNVKFNADTKILEFTANINGTAFSIVDKKALVSDLTGKNSQEIKDYIRVNPDISSVKVKLDPFWVRRIPKNTSKITLDLDYN